MWITVYGVCVLSVMMVLYAVEHRHRRYILAFAGACVLSSTYGFLAGAWPFGVVELVWAAVALRKFLASTGSLPC
ncbi:MAG: hypothetical protein ACYDAC_09730 [Candidatus Dormibacteria bacterium]